MVSTTVENMMHPSSPSTLLIEPFDPQHTRGPIPSDDEKDEDERGRARKDRVRNDKVETDKAEKWDHFCLAYRAIFDDAIELKKEKEGDTPAEFVHLIELMYHIVDWVKRCARGSIDRNAAASSSSSLNSNAALDELHDEIESEHKGLKCKSKRLPADDCLCLLVRLFCRRRQPKTIGT